MTGQDQKHHAVIAEKHVLYGTCPVNKVFHLSEHTVAEGPPRAGRHGTGHLLFTVEVKNNDNLELQAPINCILVSTFVFSIGQGSLDRLALLSLQTLRTG